MIQLLSLSEDDAHRYVLAALSHQQHVSEQELAELAVQMPVLDEFRAACAIKLLAVFTPRRLLPHLPKLLGDKRPGVNCAASRAILNDIPEALLTREDVIRWDSELTWCRDDPVVRFTLHELKMRTGADRVSG